MLTTPQKLFPKLDEFRKRLALDGEPVFVPVRPRRGSVPNFCTDDVPRQVSERGGEAVYGWMIWEWPGIMAEATFHAVWRSPKGELLDVTRKDDGESRILFWPDPKLVYTGEKIDTVRVALRSHPLIAAFIHAGDDFDQECVALFGRRVRGTRTVPRHLIELERHKLQLSARLSSLASTAPP